MGGQANTLNDRQDARIKELTSRGYTYEEAMLSSVYEITQNLGLALYIKDGLTLRRVSN